MITIKYTVHNARVIFPEGKVAERNPSLFATVHGDFVDEKGATLTIAQKAIKVETANSPEFSLVGPDAKGTVKLVMPTGKRGRKAKAGASADEVAARLKAIRSV